MLINPFTINAQLIVTGNLTPNQLVNLNLVWGGILVDTVTSTSPANCLGSFFNGNTTNLGMNYGLVMSTGGITNIPNANGYFLSNSLSGVGDPVLESLSGGFTSYDAVVLEFDFVPFSTPVMFKYIFGSEEYPEYVCSNFNDVFGFFVSGPDPLGGNYNNLNVARIPNTTLPVSINSVNGGITGTYGSTAGCTSLSNSAYYVANTGSTICFDGFTVPLLASFNVVPFQQYHIKLAVSDIGDGAYDSGVFLKRNSFFTNAVKLETSNTVQNGTNKAIEGCASGIFEFSIHDPAPQNDTIYYSIDGTAVNGVDYDLIPSYVVIPAGSDSVLLNINAHSDGINEGTETIILHVQVSPYGTQDISLNISDSYLFSANASENQTICTGQTISLSATGGLNYLWNTTDTTDTIFVSPTTNTTYYVEISDSIGCIKNDSVIISVYNGIPTSGFEFVENGFAQVSFYDLSLNGTSWNWNFGDGSYSIEQNPTHNYSSIGNYLVQQIAQNSCGADTSDQYISVLLGINSNELLSEIKIYPNPNSGKFLIEFDNEIKSNCKLNIYNMLGMKLFETDIKQHTKSKEINCTGLKDGIYYYQINNEDFNLKGKIMIENNSLK